MCGIRTSKPDHAIRGFDFFWHGRKKIRPDVTTILVGEGLRAVGAVYWTERLESLLNTISGIP
jgi:hypothetical protein